MNFDETPEFIVNLLIFQHLRLVLNFFCFQVLQVFYCSFPECIRFWWISMKIRLSFALFQDFLEIGFIESWIVFDNLSEDVNIDSYMKDSDYLKSLLIYFVLIFILAYCNRLIRSIKNTLIYVNKLTNYVLKKSNKSICIIQLGYNRFSLNFNIIKCNLLKLNGIQFNLKVILSKLIDWTNSNVIKALK